MSVVLTVDDEADVRLICRTNLEAAGFEVREAGDGAEALEAADRESLDVIVLDVMMPVMDGWDVLRALKSSRHADIPVIMLSAWLPPPHRRRAIEEGAAAVLEKPFSPVTLVETVRSAARVDLAR